MALARALVAGTGLILCDEPLSNLDADLRERLRVEIAELVRDSGATTVYITHDQAEAFALADQVGVLEQGRLVQLGPPEEIYTRPASLFVARFTGLSGELTVATRPASVPGLVDIEPAGPSWTGPLRVPATASVPGGGSALLMIRPTGLSLCSAGGGEQHLTGTVADVASAAAATSTPSTSRATAGWPACSGRCGRPGAARSGCGWRRRAATCSRFPARPGSQPGRAPGRAGHGAVRGGAARGGAARAAVTAPSGQALGS